MVIIKIGSKFSKGMFCNEKVIDLYLVLQRGPLLQITKDADVNYSYALKLLKIWESMGLIILNKAGFRYNIFYTPKGNRLADNLNKLKVYMKRTKIQWW